MSCLYGSRKKPNAVDFINPNEIGVLCSLFGLEGPLCRILDLLPEAIQKVVSLNFTAEDANKAFEDILKKVVKKTFGLIVDDLTGQIPTAQFCTIEPPPQPEDINFSDVFIFIAELVPILSHFFTANEILSGNSTKILDKIVGFWLRQKWFENCECKPQEPPPLGEPSISPKPPYTPPSPCPDGSERCKNLVLSNYADFREGVFSCDGFFPASYIEYHQYSPPNFGLPARIVEKVLWKLLFTKDVENYNPRFPLSSRRTEYVTTYIESWRYDYYTGELIENNPRTYPLFYRKNGGPVIPIDGRFDFDSITYPPCPPPPPPPPPPQFCELFPTDPLCRVLGCTDPLADNYNPLANFDDGSCTYLNNPNCEEEAIMVSVFNGCGITRKFITRKLNKSGTQENISVNLWTGCDQPRSQAMRSLFGC